VSLVRPLNYWDGIPGYIGVPVKVSGYRIRTRSKAVEDYPHSKPLSRERVGTGIPKPPEAARERDCNSVLSAANRKQNIRP
jgi:hypothetical protein